MYSFYSVTTSALDGSEWSASRPDRALAPGERTPVFIVQEAGWAPEPVWTQRLEEKISCLCRGSNLDRPVVQSVARNYTSRNSKYNLFDLKKVKAEFTRDVSHARGTSMCGPCPV
jgi:hypothetical protein